MGKRRAEFPGVQIDKLPRADFRKAVSRGMKRYWEKKHAAASNGLRFKIEKGIPLPASSGTEKGYAQTFKQMKPGDSVLLPIETRNHISGQAKRIFGNGNWASRKIDEKHVRVWRTK